MKFIYSFAFRFLVPFTIALGIFAISQMYVDESKLTSCSGKLDYLSGNSHRSDNIRNPVRIIFAQNLIVFGIKGCGPSFSRENVSLSTTDFQELSNQLQKAQKIQVFFEAKNFEEREVAPIRILTNGQLVWDEMATIKSWSLFFIPLAVMALLWLWSMLQLLIKGRQNSVAEDIEKYADKKGENTFLGQSILRLPKGVEIPADHNPFESKDANSDWSKPVFSSLVKNIGFALFLGIGIWLVFNFINQQKQSSPANSTQPYIIVYRNKIQEDSIAKLDSLKLIKEAEEAMFDTMSVEQIEAYKKSKLPKQKEPTAKKKKKKKKKRKKQD